MENSNTTQHPINRLHANYRDYKVNALYYSVKMDRLKFINYFIEIILAITTTSSMVAGLWLWNTPFGQAIWKILLIISAFLAVIKPIINLTEKIRKYEEVLSSYRDLEYELKKIIDQIDQSMKYTTDHKSKLLEALGKEHDIIKKFSEIKKDYKLLQMCKDKVDEELRNVSFFIPYDQEHAAIDDNASGETNEKTESEGNNHD
ncbi:hypothetical protein QUF90_23710 [Desulfococcaceae bacterium HSG9]|nr:hypothetical protein [Desulfococcaceae bacterium HSG9]